MSPTTPDGNSSVYSGDFQGQNQWLGNTFNSRGHVFINPTLTFRSFATDRPYQLASNETSVCGTRISDHDSVDVLPDARDLPVATIDLLSGSDVRSDVPPSQPGVVGSAQQPWLADPGSTIQRALGNGRAASSQSPAAGKHKARRNLAQI